MHGPYMDDPYNQRCVFAHNNEPVELRMFSPLLIRVNVFLFFSPWNKNLVAFYWNLIGGEPKEVFPRDVNESGVFATAVKSVVSSSLSRSKLRVE